MTSEQWFAADVGAGFEESVRIDREDDRDRRLATIDAYHVTDEARDFMADFFSRLLGRSEGMRTGSNHWLHGHYGSGKSHLLSVLDGLTDSRWLRDRGRSDVWAALADGRELSGLETTWRAIHEECEVIPVSVNLLKHRGRTERSFSELVLRAAHTSDRLTGIDGGLSPRLDVAYFEDWYRETDAWADREERARAALRAHVADPATYDWTDVQQYGALASVALPELFEEQTGSADGLADLTPSNLDPGVTVRRLESLRAARDAERDGDVKLVLLLDETDLFLGADVDRLTELQTLAENVDEVGDGNVQLVTTARAQIEDVRPQLAARGADCSIVKDRFPHRYGLSSRHVAEAATRRLLRKTPEGRTRTEATLDAASIDPATSLVYSNVGENTEPPLDEVGRDRLIEFYPFLPYQPALFLELLSNLRRDASDPARSILSGTARAVLAVVHGLLREWFEGDSGTVVSLVDFYDPVEPELREVTPRDAEVVEEVEAAFEAGELPARDVDVAKAVVLLRHVPDAVPMSEANLAVAVMDDLDGSTRFGTESDVTESLERLRKYVRPTRERAGPRYTIATREVRELYERMEANLEATDWDAVLRSVDSHLWDDIVRELSLPASVAYGDAGEEYPVGYEFDVDGVGFETAVEADDALDVEVVVEGLSPAAAGPEYGGDPLELAVAADGIGDLRERLEQWWALRAAVGGRTPPPSIERDLSERASRVRSGLVEALKNGTYTVKDRTDLRGPSAAVEEFVDVRYPPEFHPVMLRVGEEHLRELRALTAEDSLPGWARTIDVATEAPETHGGSVQNNVRAFTGRQLKRSGGSRSMAAILDGIVEASAERYGAPIYEDARPALCAVVWGLCRRGDFRPVDGSGDSLPLDAVLDPDRWTTTRLRIAPEGDDLRDVLIECGIIDTTETKVDGIAELRERNRTLVARTASLREDVELVADSDVRAPAVGGLLDSFVDELERRNEAALERRGAARSGDADWRATVENTVAAEAWCDEVETAWRRRAPELARLDSLLTLSGGPFEWLTEDCEKAVDALCRSLNAYDGAWWRRDGRDGLADARTVSPSLDGTVERAWEDFEASTSVDTLADDLEDHAWVRPASELPPGVRPAFESRYVTPLRRAAEWYDDVSAALETALGAPTDTTVDEFVRATETLANTVSLAEAAGAGVDESRARFEELRGVVGERSPEDVRAIGLLPADRESIDGELERLAELRDLSVETTEMRVIVR